jgi:NDP-mannose synthase
MKAVIMAGGLGERLKPFTHIIPKPLLPVGESSVLEITIKKLKECGCTEVIIATNYKSHLFETYFGDGSRFDVPITYSKEEERLGTAGPLRLVKDKLTEPFLVINGDILTNLDFSQLKNFHHSQGAHATVVTKLNETPFHYGVVHTNGDDVHRLEEKPMMKTEILAGIYFLSPDVIDHIPEKQAYLMTDLIRKLIDSGKTVKRFTLKDYWLDIGQMKDYNQAQEDVKSGVLKV